jgi:type II secretory pathway component PulF
MANYRYKVRDREGKAVGGTIDAPTLQVAGDRLYRLGYLPITIEEERDALSLDLSALWSRFKTVKTEELIFFSQQLSTLYKARIPLLTGLKSLAEQSENKKLKTIVESIGREVEGGSTLFDAMSRHSDAFSPVYIHMVRAGETSGKLAESLDRFITLAERELKTRERVKEATRYPKIVIGALVAAFTVLIAFVIPRFAQVFASFKTTLPLPTRVMITINHFFHNYWYLILIASLGIPLLIRHLLQTEKGRFLWDRMKIRLPIFGPIFLKIALSRFAYTFVMLNQGGIPILQTLEITSSTIDNIILSQSIQDIRRKVSEGKGLADSMKESGRFTPLILQMISVGETSGTLDEMLTRVTEYYDIEVDNGIKKLSTYIEPTLTLFLGVVVLFLALAVFLPWWNMASLFR